MNSVFENFIDSVYGGSTFEFFDGGLQNIQVIGGAEDISVDSIFGGYHTDEHTDDEEQTTAEDNDFEQEATNDAELLEEETIKGASEMYDNMIANYVNEVDDDLLVEPISVDLYDQIEDDSGGADIELDSEKSDNKASDKKNKTGGKQKKKWGGDDLFNEPLTAQDVSELLTSYK